MKKTRQSHRKSRRGCDKCKQRSVKCDEQRPCGNCVRREDSCSLVVSSRTSRLLPTSQETDQSNDSTRRGDSETLQDESPPQIFETGHLATHRLDFPSPSYNTPRTANIQKLLAELSEEVSSLGHGIGCHSERSQTQCETPISNSSIIKEISPRDWMRDLNLFHHYCSATCTTLACDKSIEHVWRYVVPQAACAHEFLMHGLLAISALHFAHTSLEQKDDYNVISTQHQSTALELFTCRLDNVTQSNCHAYVLLGSIVHMMNNFLIADMHRKQEVVTVTQVLQSFKLLKGIQDIVSLPSAFGWLLTGPLAVLFTPSKVEPVHIADGFLEHVDALDEVIRNIGSTTGPTTIIPLCLSAIQSLKIAHQTIVGAASGSGAMWMWPMSLSQEFLEMINSCHPAALIILSHYVVLMHPFEKGFWILNGWSSGVLAAVDNTIDEPWRDWIKWPKLVTCSI